MFLFLFLLISIQDFSMKDSIYFNFNCVSFNNRLARNNPFKEWQIRSLSHWYVALHLLFRIFKKSFKISSQHRPKKESFKIAYHSHPIKTNIFKKLTCFLVLFCFSI